MQNWFHFLPWAGTVIKRGADRIESLENEIQRYEREIMRVQQEKKKKIDELKAIVDKEWTEEDLQECNKRYDEYLSLNGIVKP